MKKSNLIVKAYRKYVSKSFREFVYKLFLKSILYFFRNFKENIKAIFIFLFQIFFEDNEQNRLYAFMGKHSLMTFPYLWVRKYKNIPVDYHYDEYNQMPFVVHNNKRVYYPKSYNRKDVEENYRNMLMEQDIRSPHRYLKDNDCLRGRTLVDIGASEAMWTLGVIDIVSHAYIFECKKQWVDALDLTFVSYKDKVTIVEKYVSDTDDGSNITLDTYFSGIEKTNLFLKMDIEGYETKALYGMVNLLKNTDLDFAICTYHRSNDAQEIAKILENYGFEYEFTDGYMYYGKELRKAIIRRKHG